INALYYMNHYLSASKSKKPWWRPGTAFSPEINRLITSFWDKGPFSKIAEWTKELKSRNIVELGCGVGGLAKVIAKTADTYLGVDSAFASIALARYVYLDAPYALPVQIPQDLFQGPLTGKVIPPKHRLKGVHIDFVVGEIEGLPVARGIFDLCVALNTIDMIEDPRQLPRLQFDLLKKGGIAIQSCPYIWHKNVAERLRKSIPKKITASSDAVEYLYEKSGLRIFKKIDHLPWLFLKHFRQIELYSVHLFAARKATRR
ncbi:MAG: class I SAM-dependent methyltransferase, partial [Bdellovibrionota bacterium]